MAFPLLIQAITIATIWRLATSTYKQLATNLGQYI